MSTSATRVAHEIMALSTAAERLATELAQYANAVADDPSFDVRIADQFAGPSAMVQTLEEVGRLNRAIDTDRLIRALAEEFAAAQRATGRTQAQA
jgi:hypothetical protein